MSLEQNVCFGKDTASLYLTPWKIKLLVRVNAHHRENPRPSGEPQISVCFAEAPCGGRLSSTTTRRKVRRGQKQRRMFPPRRRWRKGSLEMSKCVSPRHGDIYICNSTEAVERWPVFFFPYSCPFRHRQRLETLLKELTPSRADIANAMLFCLERADAAEEVVGHITESFSLLQTPLQKKASAVFLSICINTCMRNAFM